MRGLVIKGSEKMNCLGTSRLRLDWGKVREPSLSGVGGGIATWGEAPCLVGNGTVSGESWCRAELLLPFYFIRLSFARACPSLGVESRGDVIIIAKLPPRMSGLKQTEFLCPGVSPSGC